MCYYHQHACLLVCLSLLSTCLSVKLQWMIQVARKIQGKYRTLEFKSPGCPVSNNLNYDSSLSLSVSNLSQNHLTQVSIQASVIASNRCVRG